MIENTVLVLSGKGGVGKSTMSVAIADTLSLNGHKVGVLDLDLCGPSIPTLYNIPSDAAVIKTLNGWEPIKTRSNVKVMSIEFLIANKSSAVIWRGPKKNSMIKQFIKNVNWGELDYLIVDTPPGTSDEHISVVELMREDETSMTGAVLVTSPQRISLIDVAKEIDFCRKGKLEVVGLIENLSGYICPYCDECTNVFSTGGGEGLCAELDVNFLGRVAIDPRLYSDMVDEEKVIKLRANTVQAIVCNINSYFAQRSKDLSGET